MIKYPSTSQMHLPLLCEKLMPENNCINLVIDNTSKGSDLVI